jgi:hypothetical protein
MMSFFVPNRFTLAAAGAALLLAAGPAAAQESACGRGPNVPFCVSDAGLGQPFETTEELQACGSEVDRYREAINSYTDCLANEANRAVTDGRRAVKRYNCLITGAQDCYQRYP